VTIGGLTLYNVFIYYIIFYIVKYIFTERCFGRNRVVKTVRGSDDKVTKNWRKVHNEEHHNTNYVAALGSVTVDGYLRNNLRTSFTLLKYD
jgi:hypothetical protein